MNGVMLLWISFLQGAARYADRSVSAMNARLLHLHEPRPAVSRKHKTHEPEFQRPIHATGYREAIDGRTVLLRIVCTGPTFLLPLNPIHSSSSLRTVTDSHIPVLLTSTVKHEERPYCVCIMAYLQMT